MKARIPRSKPGSIGKTRWAAYAAAGAATALGGSHSLEAAVHYSGYINAIFPPNEFTKEGFDLGQQSAALLFIHKSFGGGYAGFNIVSSNCPPNYCAGFRGSGHYFVSKLSFGQNISTGTFMRRDLSYFGKMVASFGGQWTDRGVGFIGFKFQGRAGVQYGWARVKMAGTDRNSGFKMLDYAYADAGEPIFAGQRSSAKAPDHGSTDEDASGEGSLGGLALGAAGLLAWRKSRSRTGIQTKPPGPVSAG